MNIRFNYIISYNLIKLSLRVTTYTSENLMGICLLLEIDSFFKL